MTKHYLLKYDVQLGKFTKEELGEWGGCDAVILHSIIYPGDGSRSEMVMTLDGRTGEEMSSTEIFKSWVMLAKGLSENLPDSVERQIASAVFSWHRQAVLKNRDKHRNLPDTIKKVVCDHCKHVDYVPKHPCRGEAR